MQIKRNLVCLFSIILITVLFFNCGGEKRKVISFLNWETTGGHASSKFLHKVMEDFEKANPDIKIKNIYNSPGNYHSKLLTMIASGKPPDVFEIQSSDLVELSKKNVVLDLDPYIAKSDGINRDDLFEKALKSFQFDGNVQGKGAIYGIAKDWSPTWCIIYNKDLFDKCGVPYPAKSMSWQELLAVAKKLTKRNPKGGVEHLGIYIQTYVVQMMGFVYQNNGKMFNADRTKCLLDQPAAVEAYEFVIDKLIREHKVAPGLTVQGMESEEQMFKTGRVAMIRAARYMVPIFEKDIKAFKWGVAPSLHNKKRANIIWPPCGYCIAKDTKYPEETFKFFEFLVGKEGSQRNAELGWNIPPFKSIADSKHFLYNPEHSKEINQLFLDEVKYSYMFPISPHITNHELSIILTREVEYAILGKKSVKEALQTAVKEINEIIDKNRQ